MNELGGSSILNDIDLIVKNEGECHLYSPPDYRVILNLREAKQTINAIF